MPEDIANNQANGKDRFDDQDARNHNQHCGVNGLSGRSVSIDIDHQDDSSTTAQATDRSGNETEIRDDASEGGTAVSDDEIRKTESADERLVREADDLVGMGDWAGER